MLADELREMALKCQEDLAKYKANELVEAIIKAAKDYAATGSLSFKHNYDPTKYSLKDVMMAAAVLWDTYGLFTTKGPEETVIERDAPKQTVSYLVIDWELHPKGTAPKL